MNGYGLDDADTCTQECKHEHKRARTHTIARSRVRARTHKQQRRQRQNIYIVATWALLRMCGTAAVNEAKLQKRTQFVVVIIFNWWR